MGQALFSVQTTEVSVHAAAGPHLYNHVNYQYNLDRVLCGETAERTRTYEKLQFWIITRFYNIRG